MKDWRRWRTRGLFSQIAILASKAIEFGEFLRKRQITAITMPMVIQGHRGKYQSKARMRLPISD